MLYAINSIGNYNLYPLKKKHKTQSFKGVKIDVCSEAYKNLERIFIDPVNSSASTGVPASLLLVYRNNQAKETLLKKIQRSTDAEFRFIQGADEEIITEIKSSLNNARERFLRTKKERCLLLTML